MKKAFSVILCLLLMCSLTAGAFAADNQAATKNRAKIHANAAAELENLGFIEEGSF